ncbi:ABC transporter permease [Cesiribacter andamanensis]|uniref:Macrolide export ATP-binding/permease protein MacB n=1 Tax=Cesiribacter andamanensis AMV16 TaxID=1279009 RepID=M7N269_9BACT|nr:ABC transporter permease [Cesiribacter andamanensis]EMR02753.1 Macrolide export ATP-binding/permease protein MacB [Cesiribacter andamanensis AMV16]
MLRNYLKTAVRNLLRYKGFTFINILSLVIGITGCLIIALFVWDEHSFDRDIAGGERIYRIYNEQNSLTGASNVAVTQPAYATFLQQNYPEVDTTTRIMMFRDKFLLEVGEKSGYEEKGWFVDGSFFHVFPLPFLRGNAATALSAPNTVVISEELAKRYFGGEDPVGKPLAIDKETYEVTGVLAPLPEHFHLRFRYLMSLPSLGLPAQRMEAWTWNQFYTYVKLTPGADAAQVEAKLQAHVKKEIYPTLENPNSTFLPHFQKLEHIHLQSADFVYDNALRGNQTYVKGLTIIALFVLVIACFNFINLATARSFRRAKEIGVRKVIGADRKQLVLQFLGESVLLSLISMLIALLATLILLPFLNAFTEKSISFNPFTNPLLALLVLAAAVVIGLLAGLYPAMVLSGFQPIKVLKNMKPAGGGGNIGWLRKSLVVVQFSLSALLIVCALIVYRQVRFLNTKDVGFNKEQVIFFQTRGGVNENLETFKAELKNSPNILSVTSGYGLPGDQFAGESVRVPDKEDQQFSTTLFIGDHDYLKTLGLKLIAGRDFSRERTTDEREAFIINQTAVKEFGFGTPEQALGQRIDWEEWAPADTTNPVKRGKVIGVVQDFHYKSLHEKVTASVIQLYPAVHFKVAVKLRTENLPNTLAYINGVWDRFSPGYPLDVQFMDETYGNMYKSEEKLASLIWIFTLLAIGVGCMGLFGLAAYSAEQRTKEIGIRKVLGAGVLNIVGLLSRSFVGMVLISCLLAFPLAWWAMHSWLQDFSYRIDIGWWVFLVAGAAALLVALITVSFQAIRAAMRNPVKNLRTE